MIIFIFLTESCSHTFTVFVVVFGRNSSSKEAGSNEDRPVCGRGRWRSVRVHSVHPAWCCGPWGNPRAWRKTQSEEKGRKRIPFFPPAFCSCTFVFVPFVCVLGREILLFCAFCLGTWQRVPFVLCLLFVYLAESSFCFVPFVCVFGREFLLFCVFCLGIWQRLPFVLCLLFVYFCFAVLWDFCGAACLASECPSVHHFAEVDQWKCSWKLLKETRSKDASLLASVMNICKTVCSQALYGHVPLVEFIYLVFTCMPGERYHRRLRSLLLSLCYVFWVQINFLVGWSCASMLGFVLFQICMVVLSILFFHKMCLNVCRVPRGEHFVPHNGDCSIIFCLRAHPLRSCCMLPWMNDCCFTQRVLSIHQSGYSNV